MATLAAGLSGAQAQSDSIEVYAAGSLRVALGEVSQVFERDRAVKVRLSWGASGLLKDRIIAGESPHVFASANVEHPEALLGAGRASRVLAFAGNAMCAVAHPSFELRGKSLAQRLLDADVRVGTSTPKADPSGDYAFRLFDRIESSGAAGAGSAAALKSKALQLTGGPASPPPPQGRNVYGELVAAGKADVFITYCTNATQALREQPALQLLPVSELINVQARYALALLLPENPAARDYADFLMGPRGQAILASHGFAPP